jgi:two-component system, NtrC family, nitrogen regulation sensor histidine kinase NtrY
MKNFRINIIVRTLFICCSIILLNYLYLNTELVATLVVLTFLIMLQVYLLIRFIDTTNRDLSRFLLSIKHSDFSQTFSNSSKGKSFSELNTAFSEVIEKFRNTRSEKEENLRYLQTVMQHVGIGLISYNQFGDVEYINNAAKKTLKVPYVKNILSLNKRNGDLGNRLMQLKAGDKVTAKIIDNDDIIQLIIYTTEFKMRNQRYRLAAIQNIQSELEEQEMEAWQKLIRVLTHEIMNSITPISSLSATVNSILETSENKKFTLAEESVEDIIKAVNTIHKRSEGLIHFVNNYRNLTKIPKPNFEIISIVGLFENVEKLMEQKLSENKINFSSFVEPRTLELTADSEQIEQVLINLIINSIQSLSNTPDPEISMNAQLDDRGKIVIRVIDNGPGIPEDIIEKIFIPFFSTKQEGSGIGLSFSRQIIRAHGGNMRVSSKPGKETVFTLRF